MKNRFNSLNNMSAINLIQQRKPTKRTKIWTKLIVVGCGLLVLFAVLGLISYQPGKRAVQAAKQGKDSFIAAQASIEAQDFSAASNSLKQATDDFKEAQRDLKKLAWLRIIPVAERQYGAAYHLLTAGIEIGDALYDVTEFGRLTIEPFRSGSQLSLASLSQSDKREILRKMTEAQTMLSEAVDQTLTAEKEINKIPKTGLMKQLRESVAPIQEKLPLVKNAITEVASLSKTIPLLAGYPEQKTYLFLLENNTELRPTGGFIGTYGVLKVQDGEIETFTTDNIYNLDVPSEKFLDVKPPEPLVKYLKSTNWYLRDSNWSPDFPESAEKALWFYQQERGPVTDFDGVIAVTPTFIESLIELTGDLQIQNITFTKENFIDTLQYQVEQGYYRQGIPESERKEVIGTLAEVLMYRILALPQSKWDDLWTTFIKDVERKQILIYLRDTELQQIIEDENWGGSVKQATGDYLLVVDANMAALKSDPGVKRQIDYDVSLNGESAIANLKITYTNEGTISWKSTRYRSFTRIYVPLGSQLISSTGFVTNDKLQNGVPADAEAGTELEKTVFSGFIAVEPKDSNALEISYSLPKEVYRQIKAKEYSLDIQKQAGAASYPFTVKFDGGYRPAEVLPLDIESSIQQESVMYSGLLNKDLFFTAKD
jgi:hypothetical protein